MTQPLLPPALLGVGGLAAGAVVDTHGTISVALHEGDVTLACVVLQAGHDPLLYAEGDEVLVWRDPGTPGRGVILGRIGATHAVPVLESDAMPDELVLEARQNLVLKCGDGSITLRADGKVLIKGKELVSHAQRMNRIKGGAVSIN